MLRVVLAPVIYPLDIMPYFYAFSALLLHMCVCISALQVLRVLGPHGMPTYDHLAHHLPVTNAIILEAMRLFPPAGEFSA